MPVAQKEAAAPRRKKNARAKSGRNKGTGAVSQAEKDILEMRRISVEFCGVLSGLLDGMLTSLGSDSYSDEDRHQMYASREARDKLVQSFFPAVAGAYTPKTLDDIAKAQVRASALAKLAKEEWRDNPILKLICEVGPSGLIIEHVLYRKDWDMAGAVVSNITDMASQIADLLGTSAGEALVAGSSSTSAPAAAGTALVL